VGRAKWERANAGRLSETAPEWNGSARCCTACMVVEVCVCVCVCSYEGVQRGWAQVGHMLLSSDVRKIRNCVGSASSAAACWRTTFWTCTADLDRMIGAELVRSNAVGGKAAIALRHGRGRGLGRALAFASLEAIAGPPHHRPLRHGCRYAVHGRQHVALASGHLYAVRHMCVGRCPPRVRPAGFHLFQIDGPDGVGVILMLVVAAVGSSRH
jgi:hypothetical protein